MAYAPGYGTYPGASGGMDAAAALRSALLGADSSGYTPDNSSSVNGKPSIYDVQRRQALAKQLLANQAPATNPLGVIANGLSGALSGYENKQAATEQQLGFTGANQQLAQALQGGPQAAYKDPSQLTAAMGNPFLPDASAKMGQDIYQNQADLNKPMVISPWGGSVYNAATGQSQTIGDGTGSATGQPLGTTGNPTIDPTLDGYSTKAVAGGLTQQAIDQKAAYYSATGTQPPQARSGPAGQANIAIANRMAELGGNTNMVGNRANLKALGSSLVNQQKYADTLQRSVANAEGGFNQVISAFQNKGINTSQYPSINAMENAAKAQLDPGDISAYKAGLQEVATEYTTVFSRNGQASDAVRGKAADIVNGNLSIPELKKVLDELQAQGAINIKGSQDQIKHINDQINGIWGGGGGQPDPNAAGGAPAGPGAGKVLTYNPTTGQLE